MNETSTLQNLLTATSLEDAKQDDEEVIPDSFVCESCGVECDEGEEICWNCGNKTKLPTISEYGKKLPMGIITNVNGELKLNKTFDVIKLNWSKEREIASYWSKSTNNLSIGEYIGVIVAHCISQIGDTDVSKLKISHRVQIINNMFMGDVFYIYAYLRLLSMGNELKLKGLKCVSNKCKTPRFNYTADISTLSVAAYDNVSKLEKKIKLKYGLEVANNHHTELTIRPPLWKALSHPKFGLTDQDTFEQTFLTSVVQVGDMPRGTGFTEAELCKMDKVDIELCREEGDEFIAGPQWVVEGECPNCHTPFFFNLDWTFENFFAISFISRRRRKR